MKTNFVLQPSNVKEFLRRFNRLLKVTGVLTASGKYPRSKKRRSIENLFNLNKERMSFPTVVNTSTNYLLLDKVSYDSYPALGKIGSGEGIIIRVNYDCDIVFKWGQKFRFTPTQIKTIGTTDLPLWASKGIGKANTVFSTSQELKKAVEENLFQEASAQAYWNDLDDSFYFNDF